MIGCWRISQEAVRRARNVLLPALVLLIAAHVAAGAHTPAFAGPHTTVLAAGPQHDLRQGLVLSAFSSGPAHQHGSEKHIDHAVDRPRSDGAKAVAMPAVAAVVLVPIPDEPCPDLAVGWAASREAGPPGSGVDLALNCVWRQ
ncbi:hypothetical protein OHA37_09075 [Streptomyces sp. NBC_00335]|uniref:hypothetical protein n=1 Tax=unclassified Streptomyces TaxID=2593676 RepID=UPI00224EC29A|nr:MULTISPECIES: hypothetical protein [unclassified Streptomyces]MCX5404035.1 hypothetical protein [Streptomyces sp. NBC_00086]